MKSNKSLGKKMLIGFSIAGGILTVGGLPMFIAGGVGTYSIKQSLAPSQTTLKTTGYFNQADNFDQLVNWSNGEFNSDKAKSLAIKYDIFGFIKWYKSNWNDSRPNVSLDNKLYPQFISQKEFDDFLININVDNALFISGAVLWPIGLSILIITGSIALASKIKNKRR